MINYLVKKLNNLIKSVNIHFVLWFNFAGQIKLYRKDRKAVEKNCKIFKSI